jgi:hypothetical protein
MRRANAVTQGSWHVGRVGSVLAIAAELVLEPLRRMMLAARHAAASVYDRYSNSADALNCGSAASTQRTAPPTGTPR